MPLTRILLIGLLLAGLAGPAAAAVTAWQEGPESRLRLLAAEDPVRPGRLLLGLEIALSPGWKTYWLWPGESGAPPRLDFSNSHNLDLGPPAWPVPERFKAFGYRSLGYGDRVLVTLPATRPAPEHAARFALTARYMICAEICIPAEVALALDLPAPTEEPAGRSRDPQAAETQARLVAARAAAPASDLPGFALKRARLVDTADGRQLEVVARSARGFREPRLIAVLDDEVLFAPLARTLSADGREVRFRQPLPVGHDGAGPARGYLLLSDGGRHVARRIEDLRQPP